MPSPLDRKDHDVGIVFVPPSSPTDPRVPTAEEMTMREIVRLVNERKKIEPIWKKEPEFGITASPLTANISGRCIFSLYPGVLTLTAEDFVVPALANAVSTINRIDRAYVVSMVAEVGADQDTVLGQFTFRYREVNSETQEVTIQTISAENTRRFRAFWALMVVEDGTIDADGISSVLTLDEPTGEKYLTINNITSTGWEIAEGIWIYAVDPNWVDGATYHIYPELIEVLEAGHIRRHQNYTNKGYTWGYNGETTLTVEDFSFDRKYVERPLTSRFNQRLFEVMSGTPSCGHFWEKAVLNLTGGSIGGNPGQPGIAATSPNESVCLANDQRVSFTNEEKVHTLGCLRVTTTNDGSGNAIAAFTLNTNAPLNSRFSSNKSDHKLYNLNGSEVSGEGTFQGLGSGGTLLWLGGAGATVTPGDVLIFQPGIVYPAGSGFSVPFEECENVWIDGNNLDSGNVREAYLEDIAAYEAPVSTDDFIVVVGKERAALHYAYKKVSIMTDGNGVALVPSTERGCIAFINSVSGRIDAPAKTGLNANTSYDALVYYPPRSTESWQFRFKYCEYQGLNDGSIIDAGRVSIEPRCFIHTLGGGTSVFLGDERIRFAAIGMHLPISDAPGAIIGTSLNTPVRLPGEYFESDPCFREIFPIAGDDAVLPEINEQVEFVVAAQGASQGISGQLKNPAEKLYGFNLPGLFNRKAYQGVAAFAVEKNDEQYMVLGTMNTRSGIFRISADHEAGFDLFNF
jgi:hypothetical protein